MKTTTATVNRQAGKRDLLFFVFRAYNGPSLHFLMALAAVNEGIATWMLSTLASIGWVVKPEPSQLDDIRQTAPHTAWFLHRSSNLNVRVIVSG